MKILDTPPPLGPRVAIALAVEQGEVPGGRRGSNKFKNPLCPAGHLPLEYKRERLWQQAKFKIKS
ncbi:MAG TPA: hypothetical protein DEA46_04930 [Candidatus Moranbacteria bacterium]|nr:hypothetical protein [Candidatus Moranbacteria bacterium]